MLPSQYRQALRQRVRERDGSGCFYCGTILTETSETLEHLKARARGGKHSLDNLRLACKACNIEAGMLSVPEKLKLAQRKKQQRLNANFRKAVTYFESQRSAILVKCRVCPACGEPKYGSGVVCDACSKDKQRVVEMWLKRTRN